MLTDSQIREILIKKIKKENETKNFRIVEELSICDGQARADVALINGVLHGYEIKSDVDKLDRLENQIQKYDLTFDKCTVIVGKKFEGQIAEFVPSHWGIEVAYINKFKKITIKRVRAPKKNENVTAVSLIDLLWNREIINLLKESQIRGYSAKTKPQLSQMVESKISLSKLKNYTRETLKTRAGWRADLL